MYQLKYQVGNSSFNLIGELPLDETLAMIDMDEPNEAQLQMLTTGMEIFLGVLGNVVSGIGQERH